MGKRGVLGRVFLPSGTCVNGFENEWRGDNQSGAGHRCIRYVRDRDSTLTIDVPDVDPVSDGAAMLQFWSRLNAGDAHPAGPHQIDTLFLSVVTRRGGEWRIQALEHVTLTNPMTGAAVLRP